MIDLTVKFENPAYLEFLALKGEKLDFDKIVRLRRGGLADMFGREYLRVMSLYEQRQIFVHKYSWAVLNDESYYLLSKKLDELGVKSILSTCSGTGYHENILNQIGFDVIATDINSCNNSFMEIINLDSREAVKTYSTDCLFLSWPPRVSDAGYNALDEFKGDIVVSIDEDRGGCIADDKYFDLLESRFELVSTVNNPSWGSIYDSIKIYKRLV